MHLHAFVTLFELLKNYLLPLLVLHVQLIVPGATRMDRQHKLALLESPEVRFLRDQSLECLARDIFEEQIQIEL